MARINNVNKEENIKKNDEVNVVDKKIEQENDIVLKENDIVLKENELLKAKLLEMSDMINKLSQAQNIQQQPIQTNEDKYVTIKSLCYGTLNLSTEGNGSGDIYSFNEFGEEQNILLQDVKKLIRNNRNFAREGYFYIADESVVKAEQLSKSYEKLLDEDGIIELLSETDADKFESIFTSLTDGQKKNIVNLMISKIANNENISLNIVYKCGELYSTIAHYNNYKENYIMMMAQQNKSLMHK